MVEILYWYTIVAAGGFGLAMVVMPENVRSLFGWPTQDSIVYGVTGSVWLAFGLLSILGLKYPLKFVPVLLMKITYKSVWFIGVVIPLLASEKFPTYGLLHVVIMAFYIIGDPIAILFSYMFSKKDFADTDLTAEKIKKKEFTLCISKKI
jgi:hypothetical protein